MFAEQLKNNRLRMNLTQEKLAEMLCVTKATVSKWETDQGYPSLDILPKLAHIFSISIDELLDYHSSKEGTEIPPTYKVTLTETGLRYEEAYFFDRKSKVSFLNYSLCSDENGAIHHELRLNLDFTNPDVYTVIQKLMPDNDYIDSVESHETGETYHIWITKDELIRFQTGDREERRQAVKRLLQKGIIRPEDLI